MRPGLLAGVICVFSAACAAKHFNFDAPVSATAADCVDAAGRPVAVREIEAYRPTDVDSMPKPVDSPSPRLPEGLAVRSGTVALEFVIDGGGVVIPCTMAVIEGSEAALVGATVEVVRGSRYRPGVVNGKPVPVRLRQAVVYE